MQKRIKKVGDMQMSVKYRPGSSASGAQFRKRVAKLFGREVIS